MFFFLVKPFYDSVSSISLFPYCPHIGQCSAPPFFYHLEIPFFAHNMREDVTQIHFEGYFSYSFFLFFPSRNWIFKKKAAFFLSPKNERDFSTNSVAIKKGGLVIICPPQGSVSLRKSTPLFPYSLSCKSVLFTSNPFFTKTSLRWPAPHAGSYIGLPSKSSNLSNNSAAIGSVA
jgi:hypothetical protein